MAACRRATATASTADGFGGGPTHQVDGTTHQSQCPQDALPLYGGGSHSSSTTSTMWMMMIMMMMMINCIIALLVGIALVGW